MRLSVASSIIVHAALFLVALRLPAAGLTRPDRTISVEITAPKQPEAPQPVLPPPPKPEVKEPLKKAEPIKNAQKLEKKDEPPATEPPKVEAPKTEPAKPSALSMRPSMPVDLNLHGLGGITVNNGAVSGGEAGAAGTFGSTKKREPWKPKGTAGDPLLGKLADVKEERFPLELKDDGYHYDGPSISAVIRMDGTVDFNEHAIRDFKGLSGGFDLTDIAMRGKKQDPYRYEKEKFMEHTSKLRGELQTRARRDRLENSLAALPQHLSEVWSDGSRSVRERRGALYYMWREAAGSDDEVGQAGRKARSMIESFIRAQLPEGSPDAFTEDELKRFNSRASAIKFDPYQHD